MLAERLSTPRRDPTADEAIRRADRQPPQRQIEPMGETALAYAFWCALAKPQRFGVDVRLVSRAFREVGAMRRAA